MLWPIMLKGPCKGQVEFQIKGTLKAPTDKASTINVYYWIAFQYIDQLILTGWWEIGWTRSRCLECVYLQCRSKLQSSSHCKFMFRKSILNWVRKSCSPLSCARVICHESFLVFFFSFFFFFYPSTQ